MSKTNCIEECKKVYRGIVDDIVSQYNYVLRVDKITLEVYKQLPTEDGHPTIGTVRKWISNYLINVKKYYNFNKEDEGNNFVVYGIISEGRLVYVGKSKRGLETRKKEHESCVRGETLPHITQLEMYNFLKEHPHEYVLLYKGESDFDIQYTEKYLIESLRPIFNKEGKVKHCLYEYKFNKKDEEQQSIDLRLFKEFIIKDKTEVKDLIYEIVENRVKYEELNELDINPGERENIIDLGILDMLRGIEETEIVEEKENNNLV
jgi:hypothetical protein